MRSTVRVERPSERRGPAWAVLALAVLSVVVALFWVLVLVDALRHATGWGVGRPMVLLVGTVLSSAGAVGSVAAARLAWRTSARSTPVILAATVGLVATCVGGLLVLRSFEFHVMPRIAEIVPEHEG